MITYENRVAQIKTVACIDDQIRKAKAYARRLKLATQKPGLTLAEKVAGLEKHKQAEQVLRTLRRNSFDIEDDLLAKESSSQ